jgi:hypothetical protein
MEDALSELSGGEIDIASYFSDTQDIPAPDTSEQLLRRPSGSFELDMNEALLSSDDSLSSTLAEVGHATMLDDVPSGLARSMASIERDVLGRSASVSQAIPTIQEEFPPHPEVEVIKARTEPPGAKKDSDEPPWTVQIVPREAAEQDVVTPGHPSPVKVVQPVHLGQPTEGGNVVAGGGVPPAQTKGQGIEEARIVVVTSDSNDHPLSNVPLLDLSSTPGAQLLDEFDDEVQTNVWTPNVQFPGSQGGARTAADYGPGSRSYQQSGFSRWISSYRIHAVLGLVLIAALVTIVVLWPRANQGVQSAGGENVDTSTKAGTTTRPRPSAIPSSDLQPQKVGGLQPNRSSEPGALVLRVNNVDTVIVDDLMVTPAEARSGVNLNPGEHTVRVIRPRHRPWARRFKVAAGTRLQLTARPKRAGRRWGRLSIESDEGSEVYIAGLLVGRTPISELVLWPGPHEVKLIADDGHEARQTVTIQRAKAADLYMEKSAFSSSSGTSKSSHGGKGQGKTSKRQQGKLQAAAAIGRARTCFEHADYECCVESLEGLEKNTSAVNLLITCFSAAGHIDDACAVARQYPSSRSCSQFVARRCRDSEPR